MSNKDKLYKLDDIGFVGIQEKQSASSKAHHRKKTGEAIRALKKAAKKANRKSQSLAAH